MTSTLLTNIHTLATMTGSITAPDVPLTDAAILVRDKQIAWVGRASETSPLVEFMAQHAANDLAQVINLRDHIVIPGLVNTHHHLFQTLTRVIAQDSGLFRWLKALYPIWLGLDSVAIHTSATIGLAELILSGCTTASDHLYIYPNDCKIDDEIRAASELGIRFTATRGSMSLGESAGGLPPDKAVESEITILADTRRAIETFHDSARFAMIQVGVAPCSPFSVSTALMRESAHLARAYGVRLHTHLAETRDEDRYCMDTFGKRPLDYAESVGWLAADVWFAHSVWFDKPDLERMGACGCGVAHCPSSNMRLASGIAPIRSMLNAGVHVGLGVDGSASNDGSHLLAEVRQAMLLQRVEDASFGMFESPDHSDRNKSISAYESLWIATRGGAEVLGRDDIARIIPGYAADLVAINLNRVEFAGALHDPLAALVFCAPRGVDFSMINGRTVVQEARIQTVDLGPMIRRHNEIAKNLLRGLS